MPELLEIELYRRHLEPIVGRQVRSIEFPDPAYARGADAAAVERAVVGARVEAVARHGKLLLVATSRATLGLRFGMTGRPVLDGQPAIARLEYSSPRLDPAWNRVLVGFDVGGLVVNDPRRLGSVTLDPDLDRLGAEAWGLDFATLAELLERTRSPVKAVLLDQAKVAGLGNLLVDELLWRAGVAPTRRGRDLSASEVGAIHRALEPMLAELDRRGGSTEGDHMPFRQPGALCGLDDTPMAHDTIGGRSTWWCPTHQR